MKNPWLGIKDFLLKYEQKTVLIVSFFLISAISYEFGTLQGQKWQQKPLVIEKPADMPSGQVNAQNEPSKAPGNVSVPVLQTAKSSNAPKTDCAYVGSKSSTKFYLPVCQWAKSIKPENLVCFQSAEQALSQGRTESKCTK